MKVEKSKVITIVSLILILLAAILVIGYAAFRYTALGSKQNIITLGTLELTLDEGETITLEDVYPLTNSEGLALDGYTFTLKNTGTANANYTIYLDTVEVTSPDVKLDDKYIKYNLTKDGVDFGINYLTSLGADGSRVIDSGTLTTTDEPIDYILKIWPTVDIDGDFGGQVWKARIRIEVEQLR